MKRILKYTLLYPIIYTFGFIIFSLMLLFSIITDYINWSWLHWCAGKLFDVFVFLGKSEEYIKSDKCKGCEMKNLIKVEPVEISGNYKCGKCDKRYYIL